MKRFVLLLVVFFATWSIFAESVWTGNAAVGTDTDFEGISEEYRASSNSFPPGTRLTVSNPRDDSEVVVVIIGRLETPGVFILLEKNAGLAINLPLDHVVPVRVTPVSTGDPADDTGTTDVAVAAATTEEDTEPEEPEISEETVEEALDDSSDEAVEETVEETPDVASDEETVEEIPDEEIVLEEESPEAEIPEQETPEAVPTEEGMTVDETVSDEPPAEDIAAVDTADTDEEIVEDAVIADAVVEDAVVADAVAEEAVVEDDAAVESVESEDAGAILTYEVPVSDEIPVIEEDIVEEIPGENISEEAVEEESVAAAEEEVVVVEVEEEIEEVEESIAEETDLVVDTPETTETTETEPEDGRKIFFLTESDPKPPEPVETPEVDDAEVEDPIPDTTAVVEAPQTTLVDEMVIPKINIIAGQRFVQIGAYRSLAVLKDAAGGISEVAPGYPLAYADRRDAGSYRYKLLVGPLSGAEVGIVLETARSTYFPDAFPYNP